VVSVMVAQRWLPHRGVPQDLDVERGEQVGLDPLRQLVDAGRTSGAAAGKSYGLPYCSAARINPLMSRPVSRTVPVSARRPGGNGRVGCCWSMARRWSRMPCAGLNVPER